MSGENILEVREPHQTFQIIGGKQIVHAVDGVSFAIPKGKTLGLVGESGCGKSTCARTIIRMYDVTDGKDPSGRKGYYKTEAEGTEASPEKYADDLSGSLCFLECTYDSAGYHRRTAACPRDRKEKERSG